MLLHKKCTIGQDAQINGTLRTHRIVPRSASQTTIDSPKLTGTIIASAIAPASPDANVNIEFLTCADIVSDADRNNAVIIEGHVDIVKCKILSVDDVANSDVYGTDITIHDNVVLASGK